MKSNFSNIVLRWSREHNREYFWSETQDPYYIWLREVMLQQTRVNQAAVYFINFIEAYPTVHDLAEAEEDELLKRWQGLGYYSRARNLHATAKQIVKQYGGKFPEDYESLKSLKGIGDYTASAILAFSFGKPHVTIDGNVIRLFCRYFGIEDDSESLRVRNEIRSLADKMIKEYDPSEFDQAIMDFGAEMCVWLNPSCSQCPLSTNCVAYKKGIVDLLPVKKKKSKKRKRYFNYLVNRVDDNFIIEKRVKNDIWQGLYQFPLIESEKVLTFDEIKEKLVSKLNFNEEGLKVREEYQEYKQVLSHQMIYARYWEVNTYEEFGNQNSISVDKLTLSSYAYPKVIDCYLKDNILI